jgi:hypothetical protein
MYASVQQLKPLTGVQLSPDERKMIEWIRSAQWEEQTDMREPHPYKAKVPEFFGGVRLYRVQAGPGAGGGQAPLEIFIKKLEYQGVITKKDMYPLTVTNAARFLSLTKADMDNLGVGQDDEDDE